MNRPFIVCPICNRRTAPDVINGVYKCHECSCFFMASDVEAALWRLRLIILAGLFLGIGVLIMLTYWVLA